MTKTNKTNEILNQLTAFSDESYPRDEYISQLLLLQKEMFMIAYNNNPPEEKPYFYETSKHLREINNKMHLADEAIKSYNKASSILTKDLTKQISLKIGRNKIHSALEQLNCYNRVIYDVGLEYYGEKTTIDIVVITEQGIFLIDVMNSKKNIYIDEKGMCYKTGNVTERHSDIAEKIRLKRAALNQLLNKVGYSHNEFINVISFSNNTINVHNSYKSKKVARANAIPFKIDNYSSEFRLSSWDIDQIADYIEREKLTHGYTAPVDIAEFKKLFAEIIATFEQPYEDLHFDLTESYIWMITDTNYVLTA